MKSSGIIAGTPSGQISSEVRVSIVFIAGTTAELIKVAPVMRELRRTGSPFELWSTSQHTTGVEDTLGDLSIAPPDLHMLPEARRRHITRSAQVIPWILELGIFVVRNRRALRARLRADGDRGTVVVHGDTFSTVVGSLIGRFLGSRVAHVEAGLRSGSLLNPFPEELNRRIVGRVATIHFAPTPREVENLRQAHARGDIVETGANTVVDALKIALHDHVTDVDLPPRFGLVTLHRFELIRQGGQFAAILRTMAAHTADIPAVMVAGKSERDRIVELGLEGLFDGERFRLIDKRPYARFLPILSRAHFVVTDSGGLQEECAVLGIPCAVHRERTERHQGLGANVVLTRMDIGVLDAFLEDTEAYRRESTIDEFEPSRIIAAHLGGLR